MRARRIILGGLILAVTACTAPPPRPSAPPPGPAPLPAPAPQPAPLPMPAPVPAPAPLPPPRPAAVQSLLDGARADLASAAPAAASAKLERALRLSPRDGWLWHELARVRLAEGDRTQARAFAMRSDSLAGQDQTLRASNARLLERAGSW